MFKNTFVCLRVCQAEGTGFAISSDRVAAPDEPSDSAGQVTGLAPPPHTHTVAHLVTPRSPAGSQRPRLLGTGPQLAPRPLCACDLGPYGSLAWGSGTLP